MPLSDLLASAKDSAPSPKQLNCLESAAASSDQAPSVKSAASTTALSAVPKHVAIIMDGNGRWGQKRGKIRLFGHRQGAKAVSRTVEAAARLSIKTLTLFAFSSENWKRPQDEVSGLMELFAQVLQSERETLHKNGIKVRFVGDLARFSPKLNRAILECEELTYNNTNLTLNIALNYGGRWDVVQAAKALASQVAQGELKAEQIDEALFKQHLAVTEDVDLLIRTGGENRISNFLLYQCAYSEFYVTSTLWPDFDRSDLEEALAYFASRERRFGMTSAQVQGQKA